MFIALAGGCAISDEEDTSSTEETLLGAPVDHVNTWSVGVCAGPLNTDPALGHIGACLTAGTRCTGSLVAKDIVMTARHCVHEIDYTNATGFCDGVFTTTPLTDAGVRVTTDLSVLGKHVSWTKVAEILVPPSNNLSCAGDIVFLRLEKAIPSYAARPVAVDVRELTTHQPNRVAVVGRGVIAQLFDIDDYSIISEDNGGLKRRVLQNIDFECVSNTFGDCVAEDIGGPFQLDPGYAQFASSTTSGDSGAGVVRQWSFARRNPILIGVNSAGTVDPVTGIPNHSFLTRLDIHRPWIKKTLKHARGARIVD